MTITPIERTRLSDAVVDQLSKLIINGTYAVGEKLPSERELAKSLGVGRPLVRESFRILESVGLVAVRPGIGAIVTGNSPKNLAIANTLWSQPERVVEVIEVRDVLAGRAAELAALRSTDAELAQLEQNFLLQQQAAAQDAIDELIRLDDEFHTLIYRAARNSVLTAMADFSSTLLNGIEWNGLTLATRRHKSLAEHAQIVAAIKARDPERAAHAGRYHAQQSNNEIRKLVESHALQSNSDAEERDDLE
ncbi:MAG TPA: FadR/GntR family transcriptional regulator [Roseiflexaceae bacterium]|nr:FadR/GntR family transcriptional regulator [Roseiflexaceae bacterium]HMP39954.1 FadR/GntR family transcriptional regulator [Roseiflexaceae bacterium]